MKNKYWVGKISDIQQMQHKIFKIEGIEFGLYEVKGTWYAWNNFCPHMGASICKGLVSGTRLPSLVYEYKYGMSEQILRCPWHGWEFDLTNGRLLVEPQTKLRGYPVEIENDNLYVILPK
ncbi:Rieske (2Fe-2S) protein [Paenibacillus eucommiae]|uniref:Nitrite reductase/ring-hydroxylating ferredoxin subunit n=1 Tax=Paenibacillus eucommiae TaxID=1355755 RepID=A0ABS4IMD5_9BACL|nr:Rieske (2Fe-2S) protein [Paenibacillus eucommiae]MBP1988699.1 nitrite reductase/ring-hydroxylating ferredoxin subunit [Paenibacillus eucommiae]